MLFHACRYGYSWKVAEAEKNLLRTHTTAVSSRMLYKLAQEGFKPAKYFSIDRVFRNEAVDRTHLAEFHQIEGKPLLALPCSSILLPGGRDMGYQASPDYFTTSLLKSKHAQQACLVCSCKCAHAALTVIGGKNQQVLQGARYLTQMEDTCLKA